ncbi:protein LLP homolog [Topomyia yanbarensis]|uniref:protein LLP homolog n=1 Tax=Topomyia yanbarensis TaxID=2498891 RepID=UPI00273C21A4|nr:protein LLP homolog [Topomyia yanbarensis]
MTARSKSKRNKNNQIRRVKNKQKELKKLKRTLGLIDDDGMDLMEKVKEITEQQKKKEEAEKIKAEVMEDIIKQETKDLVETEEYVVVENENSKVKHRYNAKTKQDQFGQYPVWYNAKKERRKKLLREGKIKKRRGRPGRKMHFIDETCNWRNIV